MEIVSCIQELTNIPAKEADFQRPQPEVIAKLLEACLESFMGISAQELRQPSFETLNLLGPDHDIYVDAIGHQKFFSTVYVLTFSHARVTLCRQSFMQTVGVRDFSLADLHKPQEKRTIRNFSAIINFAKFREERIQRYNELSVRSVCQTLLVVCNDILGGPPRRAQQRSGRGASGSSAVASIEVRAIASGSIYAYPHIDKRGKERNLKLSN